MYTRGALYELAARHGLDAAATRQLQGLGGLDGEPDGVTRLLMRGMAVAGAALCGFGLILWIAANWDTLGRTGRFGLLIGAVVLTGGGAWWWPAARAPLSLLTLLTIGALFAYFGQTYQTGADPWQLFALWAVLALPLCLGARSDVLWAPWALVVMTALSLWVHARVGYRWEVRAEDLSVHAVAWGCAFAVVAGLSPLVQRITGAGVWALRTAVTLTVVLVVLTAIAGLFIQSVAPHYGLGLLMLAGAAAVLAWRPAFDVFALSAVALGLNVLVTAGLVRWMFHGHQSDTAGSLLVIGSAAAALLAGSVSLILRLARHHGGVKRASA